MSQAYAEWLHDQLYVPTYADHLAEHGALCRGQRDVASKGLFRRVSWRKAKRLSRSAAAPTIAWYREAKSPEELIDFLAGNRRK